MKRLYTGGSWPNVGAKEAKAVYEEMHKEKLIERQHSQEAEEGLRQCQVQVEIGAS